MEYLVTLDATKKQAHAFVTSWLYCSSLLYGVAEQELKRLQSLQYAAAPVVTGTNRNTTHYFCPEVPSLAASLSVLIRYRIAILVQKCVNRRAPQYLIRDCSWAAGRRSGNRVQAVKFWKSSGTTQLSVTGHSLLLC